MNLWPLLLLVVLILLDFPVSYSLMLSSLLFRLFNTGMDVVMLFQRMIAQCESFTLLAVPLFVTAGVMMEYSGVATHMLNFADLFTGRMRGGLAQVNVLLSTLMGGCSGSANADAAMEAKMLVPEMTKRVRSGILRRGYCYFGLYYPDHSSGNYPDFVCDAGRRICFRYVSGRVSSRRPDVHYPDDYGIDSIQEKGICAHTGDKAHFKGICFHYSKICLGAVYSSGTSHGASCGNVYSHRRRSHRICILYPCGISDLPETEA